MSSAVRMSSESLFCRDCGALLDISRSTLSKVGCSRCPYSVSLNQYCGSYTRVSSSRAKIDYNALYSKLSSGEARASVHEACPKCQHGVSWFKSVQMRSADEGETVFYECQVGRAAALVDGMADARCCRVVRTSGARTTDACRTDNQGCRRLIVFTAALVSTYVGNGIHGSSRWRPPWWCRHHRASVLTRRVLGIVWAHTLAVSAATTWPRQPKILNKSAFTSHAPPLHPSCRAEQSLRKGS